MKNLIFSVIISTAVAFTITSCKESTNSDNNKQDNSSVEVRDAHETAISDTVQNEPLTDALSKAVEESDSPVQTSALFTAPIIKSYLALKDALVADDDKAAANAGKQLFAALKKVDMKAVPANKRKDFIDIYENAKENAEHIGDNAGKIDHQREHLASLSKDVSDLIALFGTDQKLYLDQCPMYNNGKGAVWISQSKAIKNPYYGSQMLSCGSVKKEL